MVRSSEIIKYIINNYEDLRISFSEMRKRDAPSNKQKNQHSIDVNFTMPGNTPEFDRDNNTSNADFSGNGDGIFRVEDESDHPFGIGGFQSNSSNSYSSASASSGIGIGIFQSSSSSSYSSASVSASASSSTSAVISTSFSTESLVANNQSEDKEFDEWIDKLPCNLPDCDEIAELFAKSTAIGGKKGADWLNEKLFNLLCCMAGDNIAATAITDINRYHLKLCNEVKLLLLNISTTAIFKDNILKHLPGGILPTSLSIMIEGLSGKKAPLIIIGCPFSSNMVNSTSL